MSTALGCHLAEDPNAQAGTRERLSVHQFLGQSQSAAEVAHLVLEQQPQRLDESKREICGQAADIVVALDGAGDGASGFDDVRVQCPLDEKRDALHRTCLLGKAVDEGGTDRSSLLLGVRDALQRREESSGGVDAHKRHVEPTVEHGLDAVAFSGSEQPGVDKHAREAIADSAVDQCRRDRTVDTSREGAERALIADSRTDILDGIVHERGHCPVAGATRHVEEEVAQDVAPDGRMNHLGVELYAILMLLRILHGGNRAGGGRCGSPEARGDRADAVSVTHPAGGLGLEGRRTEKQSRRAGRSSCRTRPPERVPRTLQAA